jgi:hypothetical protein
MISLRKPTIAAMRAAALCGVMFALLGAPAASAAAPTARGYWWRLQTGSGPHLPPPPVVPAGGIWVAGDPSGQQSISAVRYTAPKSAEVRDLVLTVSRSSGSGAVLLACPSRSAWKPAEAGSWSARPQYACGVAFVKGVESADKGSWRFDVRGLARSGTLDVAILSPPDLNATFSIAFEQPGSSSIVTQPFPGSPSPSPSAPASPAPSSTPLGRRVTPITSVLAETTKRPASPRAGSQPSPDAPSSSAWPRAIGPVAHAGRAVWPVSVAALLVVAVLAGRAVLGPRMRS